MWAKALHLAWREPRWNILLCVGLFFFFLFFPLKQHFWRKVRSCGPFLGWAQHKCQRASSQRKGKKQLRTTERRCHLIKSIHRNLSRASTYIHTLNSRNTPERRKKWEKGAVGKEVIKKTGGQLTKTQVHICLRCEVEWSVIRSST